MSEFLFEHGRLIVMLLFIAIFLGFGLWAFLPRNKKKFEDFGSIPLKENHYGE